MKSRASLLKCCQRAVMAGAALLMSACATTKDNVDPYENYNRAVFRINRTIDYAVGRPIADLYDTLIPAPVQGGVSRMYSNFYEPSRVINDILQGEIRYAGQDGARFLVNSTVGLAGYFDVAQYWGFKLHNQDFGITMARWGWSQSAYVVVPLLGFYTVRDLTAVPFNSYAFTFWPYIEPESLAWQLYALEKVYTRAELRPADKAIDEAFDPYIFVRDAYLQKRKEHIHIQSNGRSDVVKPAPEMGGDEPKAEVAVAQSQGTPQGIRPAKAVTKKGDLSSPAQQPKSGKSLPDVLSLEKKRPNARGFLTGKSQKALSDDVESEIIS